MPTRLYFAAALFLAMLGRETHADERFYGVWTNGSCDQAAAMAINGPTRSALFEYVDGDWELAITSVRYAPISGTPFTLAEFDNDETLISVFYKDGPLPYIFESFSQQGLTTANAKSEVSRWKAGMQLGLIQPHLNSEFNTIRYSPCPTIGQNLSQHWPIISSIIRE